MGTTATRAEVARLLNRVGFGATAADLDAWTGKPYAEVVDSLVSAPAPGGLDELRRFLHNQDRTFGGEKDGFDDGQLRRAQGWWLERMRTTTSPLIERMTLLWHGHFATARRTPYPDTAMLLTQNETMRTHALGNFRQLALAMDTDPAMLTWLDGALSARPIANENYARELLELFLLGKYPQVYSEGDIREAARALTGWVVDDLFRTGAFDPVRHDTGRKTVLGRTITNLAEKEHEAVVDAALAQPVAARFIAYKLVRELAYDPGRTNLLTSPDPLVASVAAVLRSTGWDIKAAVRTLLLSEEFRSGATTPARHGTRTPVDLTVHAAKVMDVGADDDVLVQALAGMGQRLFDHVNVGGWPFGAAWFSPVSTLARYQMAARVTEQALNFAPFATFPASNDIKGWAAKLGLAGVGPNTERAIKAYLFHRARFDETEKRAGVLVLLLASPEWVVG